MAGFADPAWFCENSERLFGHAIQQEFSAGKRELLRA